jgi:hypothetical protein
MAFKEIITLFAVRNIGIKIFTNLPEFSLKTGSKRPRFKGVKTGG